MKLTHLGQKFKIITISFTPNMATVIYYDSHEANLYNNENLSSPPSKCVSLTMDEFKQKVSME